MADRLNLDEFASSRGYEDARILEGEFDIEQYAHSLVDLSLDEDDQLTDDPEEFRLRFVDSYVKAFLEGRKSLQEQALRVQRERIER